MSGFADLAKKVAQPEKTAPQAETQILPINVMGAFLEPPPRLDFILPGFLAGTVGMLAAPGSAGKSFLALQSAMSIAAGWDLFGIWGENPAPGNALVLAVEDPTEIIQHRLHAIGKHMDEDAQAAVAERLGILPLFGAGFTLATMEGDQIIPSPWIERLLRYCDARRPRLIVVDTLNRSLGGLDENSNGHMGGLLAVVEQVCRKTGTAVMILHHMNKGATREGQTDQSAARGASALIDNCRWGAGMMTMTADEAKKRGIDDATRRLWVKVDTSKVNYGKPEAVRWLHRQDGGVLVADDPPEPQPRGNSNGRKTEGAGGNDDEL